MSSPLDGVRRRVLFTTGIEQAPFDSEPKFVTSDLHLAAFLMAKGHRLVRHFRNGYRVSFVFTPEAAGVAGDYLTGTIPALAFVSAIRVCKGLVHQDDGGGR